MTGHKHEAHPSIPAYLRPTSRRHDSSSSLNSVKSDGSGRSRNRPHPQQQEYIASVGGTFIAPDGNDMFLEREVFEQAEAEAEALAELEISRSKSHVHAPPASGQDQAGERHVTIETPPAVDREAPPDYCPEEDWDTIREGSIARRPRWRRPSPGWVYPFIMGATFSLGMGMAPKAELLINLACLAHPPRQPSSMDFTAEQYIPMSISPRSLSSNGLAAPWAQETHFQFAPNQSSIEIPTAPSPEKRSPADEWFLKLQKDIYDYNLRHDHHSESSNHSRVSTSSAISASISQAMPTGPLPHQTGTPIGTPGPDRPPAPKSGEDGNSPSPNTTPPFHAIDPALCKRDPGVQAATAKLTMTMTVMGGLLAAVSTGYWGQMSDKIGRKKVIALTLLGFGLYEVAFLIVASFPHLVPGGYKALLIGPALEGTFGGLSTLSAAIHAYVSDTTPDGSRAAAFGRIGGASVTGIAFGPMIGSALIKMSGNIMLPLYINATTLLSLVFFTLLLLPESLSTEARDFLKKKAKTARQAAKAKEQLELDWENESPSLAQPDDPLLSHMAGANYGSTLHPQDDTGAESGWSRISNNGGGRSKRMKRFIGRFRRLAKRSVAFLEPMAIWLPRTREDGRGKDWNMTAMGVILASVSMLWGVLQVKAQYSFFAYGWTSAQLGPFMSAIGFARGFVLLVVLPLLVKFVKKRIYPEVESSDSSFTAISGESSSSGEGEGYASLVLPPKDNRAVRLDMLVARISFACELVVYILLASNLSERGFVTVSLFAAFGSAGPPTVNSLALGLLPNKGESGKLFGGLSVINSIGSSLLSPILYGEVFANTVGIYAPTVFGVAAVFLVVAQIAFFCIRLDDDEEPEAKRAERGRSKRVKRVNSSSNARGAAARA